MAITELFIGAFITVLFEKLASGDLIKLAQSAGIHSDLNKWRNTLTKIQAVLVDAAQKHIRHQPVQLWLNELQHLAYEIDDVLDDLSTKATLHKLNQESDSHAIDNTSKVLKFIPTKFQAFKYGIKIKSRLDGITTKLNDLVKEKELLGLNDNVNVNANANVNVKKIMDGGVSVNVGVSRLEETSLVDESEVMGRDGDKEALLKKLLGGETSSGQKVSVVSIVGMGGVGKTTLAQLLYNDKAVRGHFELMSWVCVSSEFDVFTISKAIFGDVGGDDREFETLNQLQVALTEILSNKRFLLVLDDVWNQKYNDWELLKRPFAGGASGSKILVTTRKTMVASVMDSVEAYPLELLLDEEALSLFSLHASGKQNFDVNRIFKLHGEDIVKKCGRLPLALRTVGRVFRMKSNEEEWEELLNSEIWSLGSENEILPALRLSYYDLPPHLKQMFLYCCLFPKDYMFDKDELVLLWMAEGFLNGSHNGNKSTESFGRQCFQELVSRSFFQHSTTNKSLYTMHDLINDLATTAAGEFFFMLDDKTNISNLHEVLEKVHHLSFIREKYGAYKKFNELQRAGHIRTFLAMSVTRLRPYDNFYVSNKVLIELLPKLQFLRVFSLANYHITEVPHSIGSLKHLRYLNFSNTKITCLPEQVGNLLNLETLLLSGCHELFSLPDSIVKLINLRHLDIRRTPKLHKMPIGIGRLEGLQTLSKVVIGEADDEFKLSDLKGLIHLQGQLSIEGLHLVKNVIDAREVNLQDKKGIFDLQMKWSDVFDDSRDATTEQEVLERLIPSKKLRSLEILYYAGREFASWIGDPSFVCITELTLRGCKNCTCLPTLGHLPSLQKLFVGSMSGLKRVGSEFLAASNSCDGVAFPSLEVLEIRDMESWEEWSTLTDKAGAFPHLCEISIIDCPKLAVVTITLLPSLQVLHVEGCSLAVLRSMVSMSSTIAKLRLVNIRGLTQLHGKVLEHLQAVEFLEISECDELEYLWESEAAGHEIILSLQDLRVRRCRNLVSLGDKVALSNISVKSVREVRIKHCARLESYYCPNSIEKLQIGSCPSVTSLTFPTTDDLPSTLKKLAIWNCDTVEVSWLMNNFLSSLESLHIWDMPSLRSFPKGCLFHLTSLEIDGCDNLESIPDDGYGFLPFFCLRQLKISHCKNLKSFPHEGLQSLASLREMDIRNCPSLDDSFPCGLWPPNLSFLEIGGLKKPVSEWGMQDFPTSLVRLLLHGENSGVVSFAMADDTTSSSFLLPPSLTHLRIKGFKELESVSQGMQHLTRLQHLSIWSCPKLKDLPQTLLLSLSSLTMRGCSSNLRKKCRSKRGKYWPVISQIPIVKLCYLL